jgi:F-type H+-transporting ATPase subunit delta
MYSHSSERYAAAYFKVVLEEKAFRMADADVAVLQSVASQYRDVFMKLDAPTVTVNERLVFVRKMFLAKQFYKTTKNLLSMLATYSQLGLLHEIISRYSELHLSYLNELVFEVTSVNKLKSVYLKYIKDRMEQQFKRTVIIKNTVDASILGGLLIKAGYFVLDASVVNQLRRLEFALKNELN